MHWKKNGSDHKNKLIFQKKAKTQHKETIKELNKYSKDVD